MGVFRQLGDPVCPDCLCQHHAANCGQYTPPTPHIPLTPNMVSAATGAILVSTAITITERCCIAVNAAAIVDAGTLHTRFEIERPLGTLRTTQQNRTISGEITLLHHAAWEVLDPGTYTYYYVHVGGSPNNVYAAWLKVIASDCEA